jgi:(2Fe-2S) ferredoxin
MDIQGLPFERIVFVCTNVRAPGERVCCGGQGSAGLHKQLKEMVKAKGLRVRVRASQSGCMDRCELGPNVMIFPDNIWLTKVGEEDLAGIVAYLAGEGSISPRSHEGHEGR